jgi:hypothetical protein
VFWASSAAALCACVRARPVANAEAAVIFVKSRRVNVRFIFVTS